MQYRKFISGAHIIEFHNDWAGKESVYANGQLVSQKSSIWGLNHYFTLTSEGQVYHYILTTKVNEHLQPVVDISLNGKIIEQDVTIPMGKRPKDPIAALKQKAIKRLENYDLEEALEEFKNILGHAPKDAETYFYMACIYSIMEKVEEGFEAIKNAVRYGLTNAERIDTHDHLAFLRMQPGFISFAESGYTAYEHCPKSIVFSIVEEFNK